MSRHTGRVIGALLAAALLAACGVPVAPPATPDPLAGAYTASGGGGALMSVLALTARFKELHPGVTWTVTETGSDAAVKLASTGDIDIGFTSRVLTPTEKTMVGAVPIGFSGTAVIVNVANPMANLTKEQLRSIYTGAVASWAELGGHDVAIRPFIREPSAATRTTFENYVFGGKATYGKKVVEIVEVEPMLAAVASFSGAVGVATIGSRTARETKVRMIAIDGIAPTPENLANGSYKIFRPLFLVHQNDSSKLKPAVKAFLDFAASAEGQKVAASAY